MDGSSAERPFTETWSSLSLIHGMRSFLFFLPCKYLQGTHCAYAHYQDVNIAVWHVCFRQPKIWTVLPAGSFMSMWGWGCYLHAGQQGVTLHLGSGFTERAEELNSLEWNRFQLFSEGNPGFGKLPRSNNSIELPWWTVFKCLKKYSQTLNSFLELNQLGKGNLLLDLCNIPREPIECRAGSIWKRKRLDFIHPLEGSVVQGPNLPLPDNCLFKAQLLVKEVSLIYCGSTFAAGDLQGFL